MSRIVLVTGSPSAASKTAALTAHVAQKLAAESFALTTVHVRDLPAEDLLFGRVGAPPITRAVEAVAAADGVVIATPIYKAAYTGLLKAFLDLLPQFGLAGKTVLPLATGGTVAHVLAIDYGLRPVLQSLGARHVLPGLFLLDKTLSAGPQGTLVVAEDVRPRLDEVVDAFVDGVRRAGARLHPEAVVS